MNEDSKWRCLDITIFIEMNSKEKEGKKNDFTKSKGSRSCIGTFEYIKVEIFEARRIIITGYITLYFFSTRNSFSEDFYVPFFSLGCI